MQSPHKSLVAPLTDATPSTIENYLDAQLKQYFAAHAGALPAPGLYNRLIAQMERPLIAQTLRATRGNQLKAAAILGLNRNTLRKKLRDLGLDAKRYTKGRAPQ
jgi:two-component system nitrogen regulation response regulator GlnG